MFMIKREEYLADLNDFRDKELIKIISGVRICGKSTLLDLYKEYLLENGVNNEQIISIDFEDVDFEYLKNVFGSCIQLGNFKRYC